MRLKMLPENEADLGPGGISTVIRKYKQHLPALGVEFVSDGSYDAELVHAGVRPFASPRGVNIASLHGMYWTGDIPALSLPHHHINRRIVEAVMHAAVVTVPSAWVKTSLERAFHIRPRVVPHGVDVEEWEGGTDGNFVLWAKNTISPVCDPTPVVKLAQAMPDVRFTSTFGPQLGNLRAPNRPFSVMEMREHMLSCSVYLATTAETFGIATLEAMAAGKPVVGYRVGFQPVIHRVTGWLSEPGDIEDLQRGLRWALEHRDILGHNARAVAATYTWDKACHALIDAIIEAEDIHKREHGITVVIPYYKKGPILQEAVDSVLDQVTSEPVKVIIVDDSSGDGVAAAVCAKRPKQIRCIESKERGGVATARNLGVAAANSEFIVCLDADDRLAPGYLDLCFRSIAFDRSLGIVYTGLAEIHGDKTIKSPWPVPFDFWKQANGQNCVPTAAMFRKEMWRRVGGYRPRYTRYEKLGYGSEDAAFWLHGTALGFRAAQITAEPLFLYRPGGGTTRRDYAEVPWHNFHNWNKTGFPSGAPTKPGNVSWPAYAYDRLFVSIIIPVGPGHEKYVLDALDSVERQTYNKTEVVVVWDSPEPIPAWLTTGFPFVKFVKTKSAGSGAGAARNLGVRRATTPFLVFLDADDMLAPDFLARCISAWKDNKAIIYTDYVGAHAIPEGKSPNLLKGYVGHDALLGVAYNNNRLFEFDRARATAEPNEQPYVWALVTCFIPRIWFDAIGGFREDLEAWEDWDLHRRLAAAGYPYFHVREYLLHYREYIGKRSTAAETMWREWNLMERIS